MTPLASLLAAVESGEWPQANIGAYDQINGVPLEIWHRGRKAFEGSTDAAISLCEAMLPGWRWNFLVDQGLVTSPDGVEFFEHQTGNTARALLIAVLRALVAKETP